LAVPLFLALSGIRQLPKIRQLSKEGHQEVREQLEIGNRQSEMDYAATASDLSFSAW
jgi:hypothetical protein